MCLEVIRKAGLRKSGVGWKHFVIITRDHLEFEFSTLNHSFRVPVDRWIKAEKMRIGHNSCSSKSYLLGYLSGFHIYIKFYSIYYHKVYFRGGRIIGDQLGKKVIVANEMYVPVNKPLKRYEKMFETK